MAVGVAFGRPTPRASLLKPIPTWSPGVKMGRVWMALSPRFPSLEPVLQVGTSCFCTRWWILGVVATPVVNWQRLDHGTPPLVCGTPEFSAADH